jgi:hypothetical protein
MRTVDARGRWIWRLSGLVTMVAIAVSGIRLITSGGQSENAQPQSTVIRTVTVTQPVTSLIVQSYGAPVGVTAGPVRHVQITETIMYDSPADGSEVAHPVPQSASASPLSAPPAGAQPASAAAQPASAAAQPASGGILGGVPAVVQTVSGGRLSLAVPACATSDCSVSFAMTVPPDVTATVITDGGPVTLSGVAGANVDSGGGPVSATEIDGPLTVSTNGGSLLVNGLVGLLRADTGGGPLSAQAIDAATATVSTGGGSASMAFSAAPDSVTVSTDGGPARLAVPGGPYLLTADSGGGPQSVGIATDPAARRSITVNSYGGSLWIGPAPR